MDCDPAVEKAYVADFGAGAGVVVAGLEGGEQSGGVERLRADVYPCCAAWRVLGLEMGVVGSVGAQPVTSAQQQIAQVPAIAAVFPG